MKNHPILLPFLHSLKGTGTAALLGLGSVFSLTVVSQGMKLSEKNQGSPAGDLWSMVRVSWLGYG